MSQRHGSADPDPPQNDIDPQHWLKILKFFDADPDPDPGSGIFLTLDPGWKNWYPGYGINIPDPQY
jgi:hypothetical protein